MSWFSARAWRNPQTEKSDLYIQGTSYNRSKPRVRRPFANAGAARSAYDERLPQIPRDSKK
jgi:hypothetical protein